MRSNVRKMWTALLAVLFAAAVGFGLWFAFAPAARSASVQAAGDDKASLEIALDPSGGTLYSNQDVNRLIGDFFIEGTVHYADGGTDDLLEFQTDGSVSFQVYVDYSEGNFGEPCDDLRPNEEIQEGRDGNTYQRWIVASIELDGTTVSSEPLAVNVTRATPSDINVDLSNNVFAALNTIPPENITVEIEYEPGADYTYTVPYGEYTILYGAGPEYHDRLEFGDTEITISYREYEGQTPLTEPKRVRVTEALVVAPMWASYAGTDSPVLPYTGGKQTLSLVGYDQDAMTLSEESGFDTTITDETPEFTMTDAGKYSVTISVNEGYKFRSDIPTYAEPTYDPSDHEKITALTYKWSISPAEIIEVSVAWKWAEGWYYSQEGVEKPEDSDIKEVTIKYGNEEPVSKSLDDVGATAVTFYFREKGTQASYSTDLPTDAGEYEWYVTLTKMTNYEDFTGSGENGGAGSFTIQKKSLTVPSLTSDKLPYNGSAQSATAGNGFDGSLMTFSSDSGTDVTAEGYKATFTLTYPDNYQWETPEAGSGITVDGASATVTWQIVQAENTATVTIEGWTYGEEANSPSVTADFGKGTAKITYSGTTNAGDSYSGDTAPTEAGSYTVKATIEGTANYKGASAEQPFTVSRAPIDFPTFKPYSFTYNGQLQTPELSATPVGFKAELKGQTNADTYTVTATLDGNYQWNTANASGSYVYDYELSWTISPYAIGVEGSLSIDGWKYGGYDGSANSPSGMSIAQAAQTIANLGGDKLTAEYLYYSSNSADAQPLDGVPTQAGTYYVRYYVSADTDNFTDGYSDFVSFTIEKKTVNVNWEKTQLTYNGEKQAPTAETDDFLNGDNIELIVSGGQTNANKDGENYTATASLSGDDAKNYVLAEGTKSTTFTITKKSIGIDWGTTEFTYNGEEQAPTATPTGVVDGDDLTLTVTVIGEHKNAATYTAEASLSGNDAGNYQLPADPTIEFVIHKLEVRIQALGQTGRQLEYTGSPLSPSITLIGPDGAQLEGVATQQGFYDSAKTKLDTTPSAYGSYYVLWKLNDPTNYAWGAINESDQISGFKDEKAGELIYIAYQITGSSYQITISANGWKVGDALQDLFSVDAADGYRDRYEAALQEGLTVTYTFLNAAGQQQIGEKITFTVNAANQNFALTAASIPVGVALNAGTYTLRVEFSESANKNYASAWASATFTVSPYELQEDDVNWTVPENLIYKGEAYTFDAAENTKDIFATYKTWMYTNGVYSAKENGGYLSLSLPDGVQSILDAGEYTLSASLPETEHAVALPESASFATKDITVSPKEIGVTLNGYRETYKGAAFSGSFTTEGHANNGKTLFTVEEGALYGSDTLEGTFPYPEGAINAGSYAWGKIEWSNKNYSVKVTNEEGERAKVFTIDPAPITVTIENKSSIYGDDLATLTYDITEGKLQGKDTANTIFTLQAQKDDKTPLQKGDDFGDYKIVGLTTGEAAATTT